MRRMPGLFFVLILAVAPAALAQNPPAPPAPRAVQIPGLQHADFILANREELGLTQQQVTRIRELRAQLERQNRPLVGQLQAARPQPQQQRMRQDPQLRQRMMQGQQQRQGMMQQQRQGMMQQQLRQRMMQERLRQMPELRQRGSNLSAEQRTELRAQLRARQDSMWARQDSVRARLQTLTDEQRQAVQQLLRQRQPMGRMGATQLARTNELREAQEQLRAHTRQVVEQIDAVLTPAQRTKLRELRQGRSGR